VKVKKDLNNKGKSYYPWNSKPSKIYAKNRQLCPFQASIAQDVEVSGSSLRLEAACQNQYSL